MSRSPRDQGGRIEVATASPYAVNAGPSAAAGPSARPYAGASAAAAGLSAGDTDPSFDIVVVAVGIAGVAGGPSAGASAADPDPSVEVVVAAAGGIAGAAGGLSAAEMTKFMMEMV